MFRRLDHLVITTKDINRCADFYRRLGFSVQERGGRYEALAGDFKINIHVLGHELEPKARNVGTGSTDFCIEIDAKMPHFIEFLTAQGIAIELGPVQRHGAKGVMTSVYVRDTDGNLLEFASYEEEIL